MLPKPCGAELSRGCEAPGEQIFWEEPRNFCKCPFGGVARCGSGHTSLARPSPLLSGLAICPDYRELISRCCLGFLFPIKSHWELCSDVFLAPKGTHIPIFGTHSPQSPGESQSQVWILVSLRLRPHCPCPGGHREVGSDRGVLGELCCREAGRAPQSLSTQLCPALCDPMDCSLPGSSVPGIFQARALGWVAIAFSREPHSGFPDSALAKRAWNSCLSQKLEPPLSWTVTRARVPRQLQLLFPLNA